MNELINAKLVNQEHATRFRVAGLICRIIFGAVFVFSGLSKSIDPLGTVYKIEEYLTAIGLSSFSSIALFLAIGLITLEFTVGLCVLTGIRLRECSWIGLIIMLFMTPFTLWIALTNPVSDCGCFGDALIIGNWETFWKNIILLVLILFIIYCNKYHRPFLSPLTTWLGAASFGIISILISAHCLTHLPLIDFRPYKIGTNIPEQMTIPEGEKTDIYKTTFIYEKDGIQKEFTFENYPWNDTTWTFVDQISVLVEKGYTPPIHDFTIESYEDGDITEEILSDPGFTFLFIMYDLSKTKTKYLDELNQIYDNMHAAGYKVYGLTASTNSQIEAFRDEHHIDYTFCNTDPITLKTIIRANPGVLVIQNGVIIDKWNANDTKKKFKKLNEKYNLIQSDN